jgi:hypothetical protein
MKSQSRAEKMLLLQKQRRESCVIRVGDHVIVQGEDKEAIVTAVHPDSQVEIEFLQASDGGPRRRRYAAEALEIVDR